MGERPAQAVPVAIDPHRTHDFYFDILVRGPASWGVEHIPIPPNRDVL
jgi:hypothetical protein